MAQERILIVEDESIIAMSIKNRLERSGYTVTAIATRGEDAVRLAAETNPQLALMDIRLQGEMDGIEAAHQIQRSQDIPVIFLTAMNDEATLKRAQAANPFGYLAKPFETLELRASVEMALYKHAMEQKLRASEARYRAVSEMTSDFAFSMIVTPEPGMKVEWMTEAFSRITGYTIEEQRERGGWPGITAPEDVPALMAFFGELLAGRAGERELRLQAKDGAVRWLRVMARPEWDAAHETVMRILGAAQDVTEKRRAEQAQAAIYQISESAHRSQDLHALFADIHRIIGGLMPAENFYVALYDAKSDLYTFPYHVDEHDAVWPPHRPGKGLTTYVLRRGETLLATPEITQALIAAGEVEPGGTPAVDWLGAPLLDRDEVIGVMAIQTYHPERRILEQHKELLSFVSRQAAMTIQRKRAELALRESEERYRQLFRQMHDGFALHEIILDSAGRPCDYRFLEINPAFERLTGLKASELIGRTVLDALPGIESYWIDTYGEVALTGDPVEFENYARELDRYYKVAAYSPQPGQFAVLVGDISERVRSENALRESELKYRQLFEELRDATFLADAQTGALIECNPAACELTGYSRAELMAMHQKDLHPPRPIVGKVTDNFARQRDGSDHRLVETVVVRRDGSHVDVEIKASLFTLHGRQVMQGIFTDITARKQVAREQNLNQQINRLFLHSEQLHDIYSELPRLLAQELNYPIVAIEEYDAQTDEMVFVGSVGIPHTGPEPLRVPVSDTISEQAVRTLRPILELKAGDHPAYRHELLNQLAVATFLCIPIHDHERVFGALSLGDSAARSDAPQTLALLERAAHTLIQEFKRKLAEAALRRTNATLEAIVSASPLAIVTLDEAGRVQNLWNPAAERLFGYTRDEVLGRRLPIVAEHQQIEFDLLRQRTLAGEPLTNIEVQRYHKKGELIDLSASTAPMRDAHGNITGIVSLLTEITGRKKAETLLLEGEERLRLAVETAQLGYWDWAAKDSLLRCGGCYETILGRPLEEAYTSPADFLTFIHPEDIPLIAQIQGQIQAGETAFTCEFRILRPDGSARWVFSRGHAIHTPNGEVKRVLGVTRDITEQKQSESSLRAALSEKETLLREIHHRIKNNLAVIVGLLDLQSLSSEQSETQQALRASQRRIQIMARIHEQLYRSQELSLVNIGEYLRSQSDRLYIAYGSVTRWDVEAEDILLPIDSAIPCGLIIHELATNALKHAFPPGWTPPAGAASHVWITLRREGSLARLEVGDNGAGLPSDHLARKEKALGLQLVELLSAQMGGRFTQAQTGGVVCTVEFPIKTLPRPTPATPTN